MARDDLAPGMRVRVPFGRSERIGLIWGLSDRSDLAPEKLKSIAAVLDTKPVLNGELIELIRFATDYYHHAPGEVVATALPKALRGGATLEKHAKFYELTGHGEDPGNRAPKQSALYQAIAQAGAAGLPVEQARREHGDGAVRALRNKDLIQVSERVEAALPPPVTIGSRPTLTDEQDAAVRQLKEGIGRFSVQLVDGVTGSGKTEVYLQLIEAVLGADKQVLVLVPEIGLTPQLVERFSQRFGFAPAVLHSGLNDSERLETWRRAARGVARIVIGTRSAVFSVVAKLGLIVIDEEHDSSLKQQEGFRYSARDLAVVRARHCDIPLVLGSATPALETLQNVRAGRYARLVLAKRAGAGTPPTIRLIDLNKHGEHEGLSGPLREAMARHLEAGHQVMIFLNRRGFAPTLICGECGHIANCTHCDARLTLHAERQRLACHHCGQELPVITDCPDCRSPMRALGEGTERIERALQSMFPGENVLRIDSDTTRLRGELGRHMEIARSGEARILVGTQMLSKGHHFPSLTLVGIINLDQGLLGSDFRAAERIAQTLVQVAGRAGRETEAGEVILQSAFPAHPLLRKLLESGYAGFADAGLAEREATHWPPFASVALLRAASTKPDAAVAFLRSVSDDIRPRLPAGAQLLGPVRSLMEKRAGRYRAQLLFHAGDRATLKSALRLLRIDLDTYRLPGGMRWSLDVDPVDFL